MTESDLPASRFNATFIRHFKRTLALAEFSPAASGGENHIIKLYWQV